MLPDTLRPTPHIEICSDRFFCRLVMPSIAMSQQNDSGSEPENDAENRTPKSNSKSPRQPLSNLHGSRQPARELVCTRAKYTSRGLVRLYASPQNSVPRLQAWMIQLADSKFSSDVHKHRWLRHHITILCKRNTAWQLCVQVSAPSHCCSLLVWTVLCCSTYRV